jgi:hypothetical protein
MAFILTGCAGTASLHGDPPVFTADQIFNPQIGETWVLQNAYGDLTTIAVEAAPDPAACRNGKSIVLHFTKNSPEAYWQPGEQAELWFVLHQEPSGMWESSESILDLPPRIIDGGIHSSFSIVVQQSTQPGVPTGFNIVPASVDRNISTAIETQIVEAGLADVQTFECIPVTHPGQANGTVSHWMTQFYVEDVVTPVYTGPAAVSEQWEGPCFPEGQPGCAHEKWYFAPDLGLVKIVPLDAGSGHDDVDPNLAISRIR